MGNVNTVMVGNDHRHGDQLGAGSEGSLGAGSCLGLCAIPQTPEQLPGSAETTSALCETTQIAPVKCIAFRQGLQEEAGARL